MLAHFAMPIRKSAARPRLSRSRLVQECVSSQLTAWIISTLAALCAAAVVSVVCCTMSVQDFATSTWPSTVFGRGVLHVVAGGAHGVAGRRCSRGISPA